jgi:hypothetical protein
MNDIVIGSTIILVHEVIIRMTIFNIFARIRYKSGFFGIWILDVVHTLDNMICNALDNNGISLNTCRNARREAEFQFCNVNNHSYFPDTAVGDLSSTKFSLKQKTIKYELQSFSVCSSYY